MIDYIFVNPAFRRKGYGRAIVALCENACDTRLMPALPISPLGRYLFPVSEPDNIEPVNS